MFLKGDAHNIRICNWLTVLNNEILIPNETETADQLPLQGGG